MAVFVDHPKFNANILALHLRGCIHQPQFVSGNPCLITPEPKPSGTVQLQLVAEKRSEAFWLPLLHMLLAPRSNHFHPQQSQLAWSVYLEVSSLRCVLILILKIDPDQSIRFSIPRYGKLL